MTRLRIMSDLHLEFGPLELKPLGEDVLILAGDIDLGTQGFAWFSDYSTRTGVPVVMVAGNHEYYNQSCIGVVNNRYYELAATDPLFDFLQDDTREVAGVTFVGCTLWTDYALNGNRYAAMLSAGDAMNDHRLIKDETSKDGAFRCSDALRRHEFSVRVLRESLPRNYDDGTPTVVVTHHLPSARSIAGRYANSQYNAAYASNLDDLVAASGAALWVHGHTHVSQDYRIGGTRVICNPRGYYGHEVNPDFDPNLIVEV